MRKMQTKSQSFQLKRVSILKSFEQKLEAESFKKFVF